MTECLQCLGMRQLGEEPNKDCCVCHGTEKVPATYWCGNCGEPLTYSPANHCSRPTDIPNPCEKCYPITDAKIIRSITF